MNIGYPFFILGNPRSGTSLFRLMLNSHPDIAVPPECGFAEWLYSSYSGAKFDNDLYERALKDVFNSRKFETWNLSFDNVLSIIKKNKPDSYQGFVSCIYIAYAKLLDNKSCSLVGDKNNYYIKNVDGIDDIFPGCKKVFIVRDGRDVACSYLDIGNKNIVSDYKPRLTNDIKEIAREWSRSVEVMCEWVEKGAKSIKYEDLVMAPKKTLSEVCGFLDADFSYRMLDYHHRNDEPEEFKAWKGRTFEPISTSGVGRFKADLTESQIEDFELICGNYLDILGYGI